MSDGNQFSTALFTDLYELTMAQAYWKHGKAGDAVFSLFFRDYPSDRGYFVLAGIEDVLDYLEGFRFQASDIEYLRSTGRFEEGFLDYLSRMSFTGRVRAMSEGAIFFTNEPVLEIEAPIIEAQVVETFLLNQLNVQTILATKCSRVVHAAEGRTVVDFAARRAHGLDAADKLAKVSYMTGFAATSNVRAAATYGIPPSGTMAHSFIEAFQHEEEAFRAYAETFPDSTILLVDTYDTERGVRNAAEIAREMERDGHRLLAVRLDSGDLAELAVMARRILDDAGLGYVGIFASSGLDEDKIADLVERGAPIDGFGVGTLVGVSADAPWTNCAYKLVQYHGRPVLKLSSGKSTLPGPKQVFRVFNGNGLMERDYIASEGSAAPETDAAPLLQPVMSGGSRASSRTTLEDARERFTREFARVPERLKRLRSPDEHDVRVDESLAAFTEEVRQDTRRRELGA